MKAMRGINSNRLALFAAASVTALVGATSAFAQDTSDNTSGEIVVLGVRGAERAAIDIKRNANQVVDSIAAEDIGKLPDVTISDSLQRITGVQIRRDAGEGSAVNVRGLPQVSTLLNGETFISAGSITTVQPDFTDIPSQLFSGADVYKTPTAGLLNGGITGTVNLRTRRPFDLQDGFTGSGALEYTHGNKSDEWDPQGNILLGYHSQRWGGLISAAYSDATLANLYNGEQRDYGGTIHSEDCANAYGWAGFRYGGPNDGNGADGHRGTNVNADGCQAGQFNIDVNGDGDANDGFASFQSHTGWQRLTERERLGLNGALQFDLGGGFELLGEAFYTKQNNWDRTAGFQFQAKNWQAGEWVPGVSRDTGTMINGHEFNTVQVYNYDMPAFDSYAETHTEKSDSTNLNFELHYDNGGNFTGTGRVIYAEAHRDHDEGYLQFDLSSGTPWGTCSPDPSNPLSGNNACGAANTTPGLLHFPDGDRMFNPLGYQMDSAALPATVDYRGDNLAFTLPASVQAELSDPNAYALKTMSSENNYRRNSDMWVGRLDGHYHFDDTFNVDFGLRYGTRNADNYAFERASPLYAGSAFRYEYNDPMDPTAGVHQVDIPGGCLVKWKAVDTPMNQGAGDQACFAGDANGVFIANYQTQSANGPGFQGIVEQVNNPGEVSGIGNIFVLDPHQLDDPEAFINRFFPGSQNIQRPGLSYAVGIDQWTGYAQANFTGSAGSIPWSGNVGVRVIDTTLHVTQHITGAPQPYGLDANDLGTTKTDRSFTDVLPAVNWSFDLQDDLKLRLAYSKAMELLDLNNWGGGLQINYASPPDFQPVGGNQLGNPDLNPWRSNNYDASLEWYLSPSSLINVAAFYIQVESFISGGTITRTDLPSLLGVVTGAPVTINTNLQGAGRNLKGLEMSWRQDLQFLDNPILRNFGFDANYTYSPSNSGSRDAAGNVIPFQDNSKHQANFILWYQGDRLQARIAENYRSTRAVQDSGLGGGLEIYQKPTFYLDAQASYDVLPNLTVYVQGSNLTEEHEDYYITWEDEKAYTQLFERRVTFGVRTRF
jgi:TonB-dependent receptor